MKRQAVRLLTATLVLGSASLGFLPVAQAAESSLSPSVEGWYQPNPTCGSPVGCLSVDAIPPLPVAPPAEIPGLSTSPYPAGTLHVGYVSAAETARTYLAFSFDNLSGTLTGAKLDVPLDTNPANGDQLSDTAKVAVCLATGDITATAGSIASPPTTACDKAVSMKYVATPAPHLTADLAPLLLGLPTTSGLVLLPDTGPNGVAESDAWHVTFSAHDRADAAKTAPAKLTLQVTEDDVISTPEAPAVPLNPTTPTTPVTTGGGFAAGPPMDTTGFAPAPTVDVPSVGAPTTLQPETAPVGQPQAVPAATSVTVGYAYPGVWLLPLAFLVLVPLVTRSLTKDLTPVGDDEVVGNPEL